MYLGADSYNELITKYDASAETKEKKEYSFKDLGNLRGKEMELNEELCIVEQEKKLAKKQLKNKIRRYVDAYAKIECDKHCNWRIITKKFKLKQLEELKKDFNLKDIGVKNSKYHTGKGKYEERIIIFLKW